jgi:hypothetical protein
MKYNDTTKIMIHDTTTNSIIIAGNKRVVADFFNTSKHNVINWFRSDKIVQYEYNGSKYVLYKADKYIYKAENKGN